MIRVLLAEDNPGDVFLVRHALKESGMEHELIVVSDGAEALAFLAAIGAQNQAPDVVLLDLNLPKADGPEILRALRQVPECAQTPVIAVTSSDMPKDRDQMTELGVRRYFRKPMDLEGFLKIADMVREVVSGA